MIEGLKPYAEYKESGQRWLGAIPAHWETRKLKHLTRFVNGLPFKPADWSDSGVAIIRIQNLNGSNHFNYTKRSNLPHELRIRPGELLFAWSGNRGTSFGPFVWNRNFDGYLNQHIFKLAGYTLDTRYFAAVLRSVTTHIEEEKTHGIIGLVHVTKPELSGTSVPVASPDEQAAIVRFLDHANRKIDGFVRAKRKLIGLLNEQKQAIIHRAVTRGLHPEVPLKPSGIPWLAEAPANWTWIPIKLLLSRMDYGTSEKSTASGSIRILTMGNIQKGEVTVPRSGGLNYLSDSLLLQHHDLLFTRTNGNPNLVGKVGIFRGEVSDRISFASYLVRLRCKRSYDPEWLHMVLNSAAFWPFARSHALVNLQTNLNSTRYGQFAVPVPPLVEQKEIVKWVGGESVSLNTAIARTEREIALMQEYRTRLTADLVTGKLDVREAAAKLPALPTDSAAKPALDEALEETDLEEMEA